MDFESKDCAIECNEVGYIILYSKYKYAEKEGNLLIRCGDCKTFSIGQIVNK